ncbi:MAG: hypothetical protein H6672_10690 [Anaerolineaceae bacterium]|nr:hypothetical protein [Anaerolineaceae bacterium]
MDTLQLSSDESQIVSTVLEVLMQKRKYKISLDQLLGRWSNFVAHVEAGYNDSIYEYINDLSTRDILDELIEEVPQPIKDKLDTYLQPLDERFTNATITTERILLKEKAANQAHWLRIPKIRGSELEDDLRSEDLI